MCTEIDTIEIDTTFTYYRIVQTYINVFMDEKLVIAHFHFHNSLVAATHGGGNGHILPLVSQAGAFCFASDKCRSRAFGHLSTQILVALGADVNNPQGVHAWRLLLVEWHLKQHSHLLRGIFRRDIEEIVSDDANGSI